ncbi:MAG: hypothetical protein F6K37_35555 [Moorea sp. SIO4E2]|nr:hypothetical protein [Moorena sp. SIO4E2]
MPESNLNIFIQCLKRKRWQILMHQISCVSPLRTPDSRFPIPDSRLPTQI